MSIQTSRSSFNEINGSQPLIGDNVHQTKWSHTSLFDRWEQMRFQIDDSGNVKVQVVTQTAFEHFKEWIGWGGESQVVSYREIQQERLPDRGDESLDHWISRHIEGLKYQTEEKVSEKQGKLNQNKLNIDRLISSFDLKPDPDTKSPSLQDREIVSGVVDQARFERIQKHIWTEKSEVKTKAKTNALGTQTLDLGKKPQPEVEEPELPAPQVDLEVKKAQVEPEIEEPEVEAKEPEVEESESPEPQVDLEVKKAQVEPEIEEPELEAKEPEVEKEMSSKMEPMPTSEKPSPVQKYNLIKIPHEVAKVIDQSNINPGKKAKLRAHIRRLNAADFPTYKTNVLKALRDKEITLEDFHQPKGSE
jgi:hypothetical protein